MKAATYLRVSTVAQVDEGYGLQVQRRQCLAYADFREWDIVREFCDDGFSGVDSERPALKRLEQAIRDKIFDVLIVPSLDRLGRSSRIILRIVDDMDGVGFVSCREQFDTTTPTGRFTMRMFAIIAELDRELIVKRVTDGLHEAGRTTGDMGGAMPLGYKRTPDGVVIDEQEANLVRLVFSLCESMSMKAAAEELNRRGIKTVTGKQWFPASVRAIILKHDKYEGGQRGESSHNWPKIL